MRYDSRQLGLALVHAAFSEWKRPVRDIEPDQPDDRDHIENYFTQVHAGDGRTWKWFLNRTGGTYTEKTLEGNQEWCGLFVAYCAQHLIGHHLEPRKSVPVTIRPGIAYFVLPGTPRIASTAKWEEAGVDQPRRPEPSEAREGDIFCVGNGSTGSHIGIVADAPGANGEFLTVEGNAEGVLGDFRIGEGVIRRTRHIREIIQLIRLDPHHYMEV